MLLYFYLFMNNKQKNWVNHVPPNLLTNEVDIQGTLD